jgi:hypothetical protein
MQLAPLHRSAATVATVATGAGPRCAGSTGWKTWRRQQTGKHSKTFRKHFENIVFEFENSVFEIETTVFEFEKVFSNSKTLFSNA